MVNGAFIKGVLIVATLFTVFWLGMLLEDWRSHRALEYRPVLARGELAQDESTAISIFEKASPSVVFITTLSEVMNPWHRSVSQVPAGTGSGFFWDSKGHIVTNYHVIRDATGAQVRLTDDRVYNASLIGVSPEHDLAVLRVQPGFDVPSPIPVGESNNLVVGQKVYAIGNPFGLDYTLTTGIVSALNRSLNEGDGQTIRELIQTDAAINPGNSGGPLLDSAGRLIGINTAIYSPSGASAGIGFAVPVDTVARVVPRLIRDGRYQLPTLGVSSDTRINALVAARFGVEGVVVLDVANGSVAHTLGLISSRFTQLQAFVLGDVIVSINDAPVKSLNDIGHQLETSPIPESVTIIREGQRKTLRL